MLLKTRRRVTRRAGRATIVSGGARHVVVFGSVPAAAGLLVSGPVVSGWRAFAENKVLD